MAMLAYATVCDHPACLRQSPTFTAWPSCRGCGHHVCASCAEAFTVRREDVTMTVLCHECLDATGFDAYCDRDQAAWCGFGESYERGGAR